ncbi:MAG: DUF1801 domain-containing protein [Anaerolineae bacterium]|uniref:DUF1801 domain-containing protein n=1 Tax=Promineifilum sp. TaxID=2664178 RepID=UPI001DCB45BD|nr:DUF1801 domain-containing protein [Anaerolineales bacterium]MCO5181672.1 DUF1801 domain-containing protein [Promineifilum sp.]MCW5847779.1 DUF1801 domain-containing protein [Anaerolineae bacterium]
MAKNKTVETEAEVEAFLNAVPDERKRADSYAILKLMQDVTGEEPKMWGDSIVGFGRYHYKYASGREGDFLLAGFAPRKQNLSLYILSGFDDFDDLRGRLGKHKVGKACLYINKLSDIDEEVLREMVRRSVEHMRLTNPSS